MEENLTAVFTFAGEEIGERTLARLLDPSCAHTVHQSDGGPVPDGTLPVDVRPQFVRRPHEFVAAAHTGSGLQPERRGQQRASEKSLQNEHVTLAGHA